MVSSRTVTAGPVSRAVGAKVRRLRRSRGWTLDALAAKAMLVQPKLRLDAISSLELGQRHITLDDLAALATALGLTAAQLLEPAGVCSTCHGQPAPGFACLACGTEATT